MIVLLFPQISLASGWSYVEAFFYTVVVSVFGSIAGWGGTLLDYAINEMVIGFGDMYIDKGLGFTIDSLWVTVRDIFNLTFIFGLVFIGLRLIFDSANTSARKTLVSLILAALLVNFSLFITKFVIDFANIAAVQLVTSAFPPDKNGESQISGSFVQLMGGQTVFSKQSFSETATKFDGFAGGAGFTLIMGTLIVFLVLTFVFMGGALLLMIRFVALMFYMLLSPLMFAGMVFPSAGRITQEFWSGFLGKAFFAPAYILMLYFSYKILSTFQVTGGDNLAKGFMNADKKTIETVLPPFVLGSIFLIASLIIAQKMGATGASGVISAGKMLTGKVKKYTRSAAGAATFGLAASAAQRTVGYGANRLMESKRVGLRDKAATSWVAKQALRATNKVADASFDARSTVGLGTSMKGGYNTRVEETKKADEAFAKLLGERDPKAATPEERARVEAEILKTKVNDATAANLEKELANSALEAKKKELLAPLNAEIATLQTELVEARKYKTKDEANAIANNIAAKQNEVAEVQLGEAANLTPLKKAADAAKKAHAAAETALSEAKKSVEFEVNAAIKYSRQIDYIAKRQEEANRWRNNVALFSGTSLAAGGGALASLAGAAVGASVGVGVGQVGLLAAHSAGRADQESVDNLKKKYGENGVTMAKAENRKKKIKEELEAKKDDADEAGDKKEDKKDDKAT
jgi:hypothetical protein